MAGIGQDDAPLGALEVVVFQVGGEVEVGLRGNGVGDEFRPAATAECHSAHVLFRVVLRSAYRWLSSQFLDFQKEFISLRLFRQHAHHTGTDIINRRLPQNAAILQPQLFGKDAVHPPGQVVEVGVGGIDGYLVLYQL